MTWLVVGLGNPGPQYAANRHNIGFMVVDELSRIMGARFHRKFKGDHARGRLGDEDMHLLKPQTFMNRSGLSVAAAASGLGLDAARVVVVHDELDLPFEGLRVKVGGGHAGHNGLRSIFEHFGRGLVRVRCGIGRPCHGDVSGWVLGDFSPDERITLPHLIDDAVGAVELITSRGPQEAMSAIHPEQRAKAKQQ